MTTTVVVVQATVHGRRPCAGTMVGRRTILQNDSVKRRRVARMATHDALVEFLREDLQHLFDDQGIDVTKYEDSVQFEDPITRHTTIQGYTQNIQFLKNVFNPTFILRDIKQTGESEIAFRWTMHMRPVVPFLGALTFTGTSRLGVSPDTGKFNRHIDTWDAIENQGYFSIEAFVHMLGQLMRSQEDNSSYNVLVKRKEYEIREYCDGTIFCDVTDQDPGMMQRVVERDGLKKYLVDPWPCHPGTRHLPLQGFILSEYLPLE